MPRPNPKKKEKGLDKTLNSVLYCYLQPECAAYAKKEGKKLFGSFSGYVNALIANDMGKKPELGAWKAEGESKALRETKKDPKQLELPGLEKPEPFTPMGPPGTANYRDPVV